MQSNIEKKFTSSNAPTLTSHNLSTVASGNGVDVYSDVYGQDSHHTANSWRNYPAAPDAALLKITDTYFFRCQWATKNYIKYFTVMYMKLKQHKTWLITLFQKWLRASCVLVDDCKENKMLYTRSKSTNVLNEYKNPAQRVTQTVTETLLHTHL